MVCSLLSACIFVEVCAHGAPCPDGDYCAIDGFDIDGESTGTAAAGDVGKYCDGVGGTVIDTTSVCTDGSFCNLTAKQCLWLNGGTTATNDACSSIQTCDVGAGCSADLPGKFPPFFSFVFPRLFCVMTTFIEVMADVTSERNQLCYNLCHIFFSSLFFISPERLFSIRVVVVVLRKDVFLMPIVPSSRKKLGHHRGSALFFFSLRVFLEVLRQHDMRHFLAE